MTLGSIFASSIANAGCYQWDNAYEHQCWGPWIDSPDLYKEANGDPFTIGGGDDSQWHFSSRWHQDAQRRCADLGESHLQRAYVGTGRRRFGQ